MRLAEYTTHLVGFAPSYARVTIVVVLSSFTGHLPHISPVHKFVTFHSTFHLSLTPTGIVKSRSGGKE